MYHVSAQGIDEHMINVHYYYFEFLYKKNKDVQHPEFMASHFSFITLS